MTIPHALTLDRAYPAYRLQFFRAERNRQREVSGGRRPDQVGALGEQKHIFSRYFATMCASGAFPKFVEALEAGMGVGGALRDILHISTPFHRYLIAQDLHVLMPDLVGRDAVDNEVYIRGGSGQSIILRLGAVSSQNAGPSKRLLAMRFSDCRSYPR